MSESGNNIMEKEIKGISARILWQAFAGWTTMIFTLLAVYFSLKSEISNANLVQSRTDAIQDIRIDAVKREVEINTLKMKDMNQRLDEKK